jgi:hypothetical protein
MAHPSFVREPGRGNQGAIPFVLGLARRGPHSEVTFRATERFSGLAFEPVGILLQDVVIRHPRDVVGDHAGHTLAGELGLAGIR